MILWASLNRSLVCTPALDSHKPLSNVRVSLRPVTTNDTLHDEIYAKGHHDIRRSQLIVDQIQGDVVHKTSSLGREFGLQPHDVFYRLPLDSLEPRLEVGRVPQLSRGTS